MAEPGKICVLVCPMDWGLGHASRCIPVIRAFRMAGCRVVVAADGQAAAFIRRELPDVEQVSLPGFRVRYLRHLLFLGLLLQVPAFLFWKWRERRLLESLVEKLGVSLIVSDNRYGLIHRDVPSVLITHQLRPSLPRLFRWLEPLVAWVIRSWAARFDRVWVPDLEGAPTAGGLAWGSDRLPDASFTGWLSRFEGVAPGIECPQVNTDFLYSMLFLLSGPEPHRSDLERLVTAAFSNRSEKVLLVRGVPGGFPEREVRGGLEIVSFMDSNQLLDAICCSETVVCRSGYSSVMDLLALGREALLVPTPGQTEQEYLSRWLEKTGRFMMLRQRDLDTQKLAELAGRGHKSRWCNGRGGVGLESGSTLLDFRVREVLDQKVNMIKKAITAPPR